jgi:hypothetical protein
MDKARSTPLEKLETNNGMLFGKHLARHASETYNILTDWRTILKWILEK